MASVRTGGLLAAAVVAACGYAIVMPTLARAWVPGPAGEIAYASDESQPGDTAGVGPHGTGSALGYHIWVINPDGSGRRELTHGDDADPSWSPDGRQIVFTRQEGAGWRIWVMSNTGADQRPLTPPGTPGGYYGAGNVLPRFSPDGTRIAFVSQVFLPTWNFQVWVMDSDGGDLHQITDLPVNRIDALTWSPDSSHLLFWSTDIVHPTSDDFDGNYPTGPVHIYEMTSEGGAIHQIAYDPRPPVFGVEGEQVGGLDWATVGLAVAVPVDGIHVASGVSDGSPPTPVSSAGGNVKDPTWSPDSARQPKLAFSLSSHGLYASYELYRTNPLEQITFDGFDHVEASWGPAVRSHLYLRASASLVQAFERGSSAVRVLLGCPASAGRRGCLEVLIAAAESGARTVGKYRGRAGISRVVVLRLSKRFRSLGVGQKLLLTLRATMRGRTTVVRQRATVFATASIAGRCPAPKVTLGASVTFSGVLRASAAGAHAATSGARARVGMLAMVTPGLTLPATAKTDGRGHFALTFTPKAPGLWTFQMTWNGDRTHASTHGPECAVLVNPPPPPQPAPTALAVTCQPGTAGTPVPIGGTLTPAVPGAVVKLTYQRVGVPTDTIVNAIGVATDGSFADQPVPDAAGTWDAVASYAGDANHKASTSSTCQFTVATQPAVLTLSCPAVSSLGKVLGVTGSLTPALLGTSITLTYTHQTQGPLQTFTSIVTTDGSGNFSDATITATGAGEWDVTASFAGDATRSPASSPPCAIQVS